MLKNVLSEIEKATSFDGLLSVFDKHIHSSTPDTKGAQKRVEANKIAIEILERVKGDYSLITEEDREKLREYSGLGGIGASTNEYYTPKWVASAVWDSLAAYGFTGGKTLEPSAGVGIFSETKPDSALITSVEMDQTSSAINQILHPDDHVINSPFEAIATDNEIGGFDAVIGNPPYGDRDRNIAKDKQYSHIKRAELYFIERSIDKARAGGLIALVLPTGVVDKKSLKKWRTSLSLKAEFLGAHRLPSGIFSHTDVTTDLVIWRKHSDELAEMARSADLDTLKAANILWDTWLNGRWFQEDGKRFIQGEQFVRGKGKFARTVVDRGERTNEQIAKALSMKFHSRIDWEALSQVEPISEKYTDGDTAFHNGQQMVMENGQWVISKDTSKDTLLDIKKYGLESPDEINTLTVNGLHQFTASQLIELQKDYGYKLDNSVTSLIRELEKLPQASRDKTLKGVLLGKRIRVLQDMISRGGDLDAHDVDLYRKQLGADIADHFAKNGNRRPTGLNKIEAALVSDWNAYQTAISKDGKLSDLLRGDLTKEEIRQYDTSKVDHVLAYARNELQRNSLFLDELRDIYTHSNKELSDKALLEELARNEDVAINSDGSISSMHQATSGNVAVNIGRLNKQLANEESAAIQENIKRQIATIESKRNKINLNTVHMKMTDKWIPKHILLEFLHDQGYTEFKLGDFSEDEEGFEDFTESKTGTVFTGYRWSDGKKVNRKGEEFERQVESYINSGKVQGGSGNAGKALVRERIRRMDKDFTNWLASSDHAEALEAEYNERFANWIEPEYSEADLNLKAVSDSVTLMGYQNATIRKHSDDGCGIIAFGTGLGKTLSALALGEYNLQTGRASRIAYVVPKSVIENWFFESDLFFGEGNLKNKVFIGVQPVIGEDGKFERELLLDEEGKPKKDAAGNDIYRPKLIVDTSTKKIAEQLHSLAQSKARMVIMTKDVYNRIPMRDSTVSEHVEGMIEAGLVANSSKYVAQAENYREAQKNAKFEAKYADEGTAKKKELPYFEDLLFDNVIVDEGHDFRNSYKSGSYGNALAYLPNAQQADRALDMQIKNNHIKSRNDGKGVFMLTATPTVNSPVDAFNMLSHVLPPDVFARMGIVDGDDFIRLFGRTGETAVTKLSGAVETKEALLGFQNLDALRKLFNRHVTIKDIKDVKDDVHIPELEASTNYVDMSEEQASIYEELRQRADALSNPDDPANQEIIEQYPDDSVFGLIRKMDKACTDLDLYNGVITYRFDKSKASEVDALLSKLKVPKVRRPKLDETGEPEINEKTNKVVTELVDVEIERKTRIEGKFAVVTLIQELDDLFGTACKKAGLRFSHPVSPKYAKFLENAKTVYLSGGKQLVFTEEKTQHVKLARIISDYIGCDINEIGIINSDTVAGKKGSKASDEDIEAGLEAIADAYNTGRYKFVIANKKAEVGINLHHGTTDIHHLTLPFTPSSLTQRNGRGARVGSKADKVNVHYYAGKGSFDKFRIETIERKAKWIQELFTGEESFVENGNLDDGSETAVMLAADPEQAKARLEAAKRQREEAIKAEMQRQASITVSKYVKASIAANADIPVLETRLIELVDLIAEQQKITDERREAAKGERRNSWEYERYNRENDKLQELRGERARIQSTIKAAKGASETLKRLKPAINQSIDDGTLAGYEDIFTNAENYATKNGAVIRKGYTYHAKIKDRSWDSEYTVSALVTVKDFDRREGTVSGVAKIEQNGKETTTRTVTRLPMEMCYQLADVDHSAAEIEALLSAPHSFGDVASKVDRDTYHQLVSEGKVKYYAGEAKAFYIDANGKYGSHFDMTLKEGERMVYPDATDKATSKAILKQITDELEEKGRVMSISSWHLVAFLGRNWEQMAIEAGNQATEEEVTKVTLEIVDQFIKDNDELYQEALRNAAASYNVDNIPFISELKKELDNFKWQGFTNRREIVSMRTRVFNVWKAELKEMSKEHRQVMKDKAFNAYRALIDNDPERNERLKKVADVMGRYKQSHRVRSEIETIYGDNAELAILHMRADLAAVGRDSQSDGSQLANLDSNRMNAIWAWEGVFSRYRNVFIQDVNKLVQGDAEPEKAPSITEKKQAKIDAINASNIEGLQGFISECAKIGITVKEVTQDLVWTGKRGRRTFNNKVLAYSKLALQDENGVTGALKPTLAGKRNADVKDEFGASYGADCGEGFEGSWWFIDSDSDLQKFASLLSENA